MPETNRPDALQMLQDIIGYTRNASDQTVVIFQDDATHTVHMKVGNHSSDPRARSYCAGSLAEVLSLAHAGENAPGVPE